MHVIIWEFRVRDEHLEEFISAYGATGDWARLFQCGAGYVGTELLRSRENPNLFLTVDRWESAACFEIFQQRFAAEYKALDIQCANYTSHEKKLGVFSEG